jgi:hypothetical protein
MTPHQRVVEAFSIFGGSPRRTSSRRAKLPTTKLKTRPRATATVTPVPQRHHLDKRARAILIAAANADGDELLTTIEMAAWFGTTPQFLEKARKGGYGPPYIQVGSQMIRYSRAKARAWLESRARRSTADYRKVKA